MRNPIRAISSASKAIAARIKSVSVSVVSLIKSPIAWLLVFSIGSALLFSFGINILFGFGWALISASVYCILFAAVIFRGLGNG